MQEQHPLAVRADPRIAVADRDRDVVETADHDASALRLTVIRPRRQTTSTCTRHIGFFCQWPAIAARTPRLIASSTACGSRRRGFGNDSNVSIAASYAIA